MNSKPFDNFTNLYELSKTLRFELKPTPETLELLKKTNLHGQTPVQADKEIDEIYHKEMKPLFDELHELFITHALETVNFNLENLQDLEKLYDELRKLTKDKKEKKERLDKLLGKDGEISKIQKQLREVICEQFDIEAEKWKKKYPKIKLDDGGCKILTNAKIIDVLLILHPEKCKYIKKFQGFFTYFRGFNQNRENYYTSEPKATGIANRIININYVTYTENKQIFELIEQKIPKLSEYKKYFELENYKNCLTQEAIENFNENIVGKINLEKNLFLQQENTKTKDKKEKYYLSNLRKLYKQIGCRTKQQKEQETSGKSIYPEYLEKVGLGFQITKNEQGKDQNWEALGHITEELKLKLKKLKENYQNFFNNNNWQEYKLDEIWFRKESVNTISGKWFGGNNWAILTKALNYVGTGKIEKDEYKIPPFVSLLNLKEAMEVLETGVNLDIKKLNKKNRNVIEINNGEAKKFSYSAENLFRDNYQQYYKNSLFETFLSVWQYEIDFKFTQIFDGYTDKEGKVIPAFLNEFEEKNKELFDKSKKDATDRSIHTEVVKNLIEEGYLRLYQLTKYHSLEKKGEKDPRPTDGKFYDILNDFWKDNEIVIYHKALQATLTKKPYSENKIKLNFENGSLLGGFSDGQERNKAGVILKNDNKYYLGILRNRMFFRTDKPNPLYETNNNNWQRLILTNLKFQTLAGKGFLGKYKIKYSDLGKTDPLKAVVSLQEFIKKHPHFLLKHPKMKTLINKNYKSKKDFDVDIKEVLKECFTMKFVPIRQDVLQQGIQQDYLYLFEIRNKDFSEFSKGKNKNIHTMYWEKLFDDENLEKPILALNGGAEVFFRKGQKEKLQKKFDKSNPPKEVLSNKRYGEDKYFLHASISINYGKPKNIKYRELINQAIKENADDIKIIGIDRGEKHLLYYSVIDSSGKIIEQNSLNKIEVNGLVEEKIVKTEHKNGEIIKVELENTEKRVNYVDYQVLLDYYEKKRILARKSWEVIGKIKDLKEGYLSQAVHEIYKLIIKYNAIVVLEDLNSEFKAKRLAKVEKSVYKKFELALARKLNHLILKDKEANETGGVLKAYQLTPEIRAGDISKFEKAHQWGIMFYIRANYTSTTDPLTGWRRHKYIPNSEIDRKIQENFNPQSGIQINYDQGKKCYKFTYQNENNKIWQLFAFNGIQRFYWDSKDREVKSYNLYLEFDKLFASFDKAININQQIYEKSFNWKRLVFLWNLLNQIRNTDRDKTGNKNDFIQSPVWSEKYKQFFDSRLVKTIDLPDNGDANGAFNIARKGSILLKRIKNCEDITKFGNDNNGKDPENGYFISDIEWDKVASKWQ